LLQEYEKKSNRSLNFKAFFKFQKSIFLSYQLRLRTCMDDHVISTY